MSAAVTEILHDAYMGRLTSIRTVQPLAGMDNLTAARRYGWIGMPDVRISS